MAISWAVIVILLKGVSGLLPSIVLLSLFPDPDNFLENYMVLSGPSGSNNTNGYHWEGSGGSNGNGGSTGPGGNRGPNGGPAVGNHGGNSQSNSDDIEHPHVNASYMPHQAAGHSSEVGDLVSRLYNANHPVVNSSPHLYRNEQGDIFCKHFGKMDEIYNGGQGVRCSRDYGIGRLVAGAEDRSSPRSHTTRVVGGWSCRGCSLKICAICASNELSWPGSEIEPTRLNPPSSR